MLAATLGLAAAASCEIVLGDLPPVAATDAGGGHDASGTTTSTSTQTTGTTTHSTTSTTSTTGTTSTSTSTVTGTGGACCDCDGDEYRSEALCGADDCDDHDPLVHPGQTMYFATASPNPNVGFDYNCDGLPEPQFPNAIHCNLLTISNGDAGVGFLDTVPPCGMTGSWGNCVPSTILTCAENVIDSARVCACH
jgi:hypothetical protein